MASRQPISPRRSSPSNRGPPSRRTADGGVEGGGGSQPLRAELWENNGIRTLGSQPRFTLVAAIGLEARPGVARSGRYVEEGAGVLCVRGYHSASSDWAYESPVLPRRVQLEPGAPTRARHIHTSFQAIRRSESSGYVSSCTHAHARTCPHPSPQCAPPSTHTLTVSAHAHTNTHAPTPPPSPQTDTPSSPSTVTNVCTTLV